MSSAVCSSLSLCLRLRFKAAANIVPLNFFLFNLKWFISLYNAEYTNFSKKDTNFSKKEIHEF